MVTWAEFETAAPEMAAEGRRLLYARGDAEALLATVRDDEPPRIHPINVGIVQGRLYAFLLRSPKRGDLERDGRFALHTHQDPAAPDEFSVRGRARPIDDTSVWSAVAREWYFTIDETYGLFEFSIESVLLGRRAADEWPPRYLRWTADPVSSAAGASAGRS
ncbi:MAG: pyridoxamine 5'-phosphate oxidase family protein [Chloroflexota bacterium]